MTEVIVGTLRDTDRIETQRGVIQSLAGFESRAAWSWLRLQHGRSIDDEIKEALRDEEGRRIRSQVKRNEILLGLVDGSLGGEQRELQYILDDGVIKAVATLDHLLIPPEEVEVAAREILARRPLAVEADPILSGLVATDRQEISGLYTGFHVDPGDILTRRAISVSSYVYTILCTNPLTWAGIGNFNRFGMGREHERILRIHRVTELRPRLERAIDDAVNNLGKLRGMVEYARENRVDPKEARVILTAFARAYGLGDKVIKELLGRLQGEDPTTFGMSQAASYTARHGEKFRETPEGRRSRARQSMATVGAASLLIQEPGVTYEKAQKWLRGRLAEIPDYLKDAL